MKHDTKDKQPKGVVTQTQVVYEDPVFVDELDYLGPNDGFERIIVDFTDEVKRTRPGMMRTLVREGWVVELESKLAPGMFRLKMPKERWEQIQGERLAHYQSLLLGMPTPSEGHLAMQGRTEVSNETISTEELMHFVQQGKAPIAQD